VESLEGLTTHESWYDLYKSISLKERKINKLFGASEKAMKAFFAQGRIGRAANQASSLRRDEPGSKTTQTPRGMGKVIKMFYDELHKGEPPSDNRTSEIRRLMEKVKNKIPAAAPLDSSPITVGEVDLAIKRVHNLKAPGPDGIPYEWWKYALRNTGDSAPLENLTKILNSHMRQIHFDAFAEADLSLLYKKGDTSLVKNYRPISLMNTDYKILTSIIAARTMKVAKSVIHMDQLGFVSGRDIRDHTKFSQLLSGLNDPTLGKGTLLALDAEKAYDRVEHDYLWSTLETFGIKGPILDAIKNIYRKAKTNIWVNGFNVNSVTKLDLNH